MNEEEFVNWLKICNVNGLGPKKILNLYNLFKDINAVIDASPNELKRSRIFNEKMINDWEKLKKASPENFFQIIRNCKKNNITIIPIVSEDYPSQLKLIPSPPVNLFVQGRIDLLFSKKVAIVGSRKSNEIAKKWASETASKFSMEGITVVSGGAIGIDVEAHKGALNASGKTISVLGSGLLKLYPEEHLSLFDEIRKKGLLISEHLPNFTGGRIALLRRNRITSGISDAMIVVTSSNNGGSMTQLKHAYEQRIPIFCPKSSFHFIPNEGIETVKKKYKIVEIEDIKLVLEVIKKKLPVSRCSTDGFVLVKFNVYLSF